MADADNSAQRARDVRHTMGDLSSAYSRLEENVGDTAVEVDMPTVVKNTPRFAEIVNYGADILYVSFNLDDSDISIPAAGAWSPKGVIAVAGSSFMSVSGGFLKIILKRDTGAVAANVLINIR